MDEFTSAADEKDENVEDSSELDSEDSESQNELKVLLNNLYLERELIEFLCQFQYKNKLLIFNVG